MVDLAVVHYHLLPGGVTSVIRDGLRAIIQHRPGLLRSVRLIAGRRHGVDALLASLRAAAAGAGADTDVQATVDPRLDYDACGSPDQAYRGLSELVRPDAIWWVHNHHLGKNLPFTRALLGGEVTGGARVLLQVHDFPECGRIDGYAAVHAALGSALYPFGPEVRYAVINRRDQAALSAAGVPELCLHLLWNPVAPSPAEPRAERLAPLMPAGDRLWLYPVRARRRKNVLEAGLLARMVGDAAVGVTLPASSAPEAAYYRQASSLFRDGTLPGRVGFGEQPRFRDRSLAQLAGGADAVVSSSIEEGFGYQYLHARQWRLPLIARDIEAIDGFRDLLRGPATALYERLDCPLSRTDRAHLADRYRVRLTRLRPLLPSATLREVAGQIDAAIAGPQVDYSFLSFDLQRAVAGRCRSPEELHRLREANGELLERVRALPERPPPALPASDGPEAERDQELERRFGAAAFAERAARVLAWQPWSGSSGTADADAVLARFAAAPYQRLLFDPM